MVINEQPASSRNTHAFTLAEVMVAVVLMLLMALVLYAGFTQGFAIIRLTQENLRATQILVRHMENVRLYTESQLTNPAYFKPSYTTYYDPSGAEGGYGTTYTVVIDTPTIPPPSSGLPEGYRTNMYLITATVYWTNTLDGKTPIVRSRTMQTYYAKYGLIQYVGF